MPLPLVQQQLHHHQIIYNYIKLLTSALKKPPSITMQLTQILLVGLATSASAIDVFFGCSGTNPGCRNLNPNNCCNGARRDFTSEIGFYGIPSNWRIQARGHYNGNCAELRNTQNSNGATFICLRSNPFYSGAGYGFLNKKRDITEESAPADKCVEPNTLRYEDGTLYDIAGLDAEVVANMCVDYILDISYVEYLLTSSLFSTKTLNAGGAIPAEIAALKVVE